MLRFLPTLFITALLAAAVGGFTALVTRALYVPILVPMFMGAATGAAVGFVAHAAAFHRGLAPWLLALGAFASCVFSFHYVEYADGFVRLVREAHEVEDPTMGVVALTDEQARGMADHALKRAVGTDGFVGFLRLRARAGLQLKGFGGGATGTSWSMILWLVDLLVVLLMIARVGVGAAARR